MFFLLYTIDKLTMATNTKKKFRYSYDSENQLILNGKVVDINKCKGEFPKYFMFKFIKKEQYIIPKDILPVPIKTIERSILKSDNPTKKNTEFEETSEEFDEEFHEKYTKEIETNLTNEIMKEMEEETKKNSENVEVESVKGAEDTENVNKPFNEEMLITDIEKFYESEDSQYIILTDLHYNIYRMLKSDIPEKSKYCNDYLNEKSKNIRLYVRKYDPDEENIPSYIIPVDYLNEILDYTYQSKDCLPPSPTCITLYNHRNKEYIIPMKDIKEYSKYTDNNKKCMVLYNCDKMIQRMIPMISIRRETHLKNLILHTNNKIEDIKYLYMPALNDLDQYNSLVNFFICEANKERFLIHKNNIEKMIEFLSILCLYKTETLETLGHYDSEDDSYDYIDDDDNIESNNDIVMKNADTE